VNSSEPEGASAMIYRVEVGLSALAGTAITVHLILRFGFDAGAGPAGVAWSLWPLIVALVIGGLPMLLRIALEAVRGNVTADLLAALAIATSVWLQEYLAGAIVVLMITGGQALESYAVRRASSVLDALARRMPSVAHRREDGKLRDVGLRDLAVGDEVTVFPHESCPVDGVVVEGHGSMDESYLTGEPYVISKAPGAAVLSGAINGEAVLTVRAEKLPADSRYARIMQVMRDSAQRRPTLRRMGDRLGAVYTPIALALAALAWGIGGDPVRFLAVLVVATPCPLLIGIPVAIIGSVSLAARRGIIIKDPATLERIEDCRTALFDKTGTLTYGRPALTEVHPAEEGKGGELLRLVASLERYSRHPLAAAVLERTDADGLAVPEALAVSERPGQGLRGRVDGHEVLVTGRKHLPDSVVNRVQEPTGGLECVVLVDGDYAGRLVFRDEPRAEGESFIRHLRDRHRVERVIMVSGDRASEVQYLADQVGISEVHAGQSPEQKLALVREETSRAPTLFMGDGINDAPALTAATVGIAFGQGSDITAEAAGAVIMESSLQRVDELLHIGRRMRRIALQSAVGGMALSVVGMLFAMAGLLPPVAGAVAQEVIDVIAIANALRVAFPGGTLADFHYRG